MFLLKHKLFHVSAIASISCRIKSQDLTMVYKVLYRLHLLLFSGLTLRHSLLVQEHIKQWPQVLSAHSVPPAWMLFCQIFAWLVPSLYSGLYPNINLPSLPKTAPLSVTNNPSRLLYQSSKYFSPSVMIYSCFFLRNSLPILPPIPSKCKLLESRDFSCYVCSSCWLLLPAPVFVFVFLLL